MLKVSRTPPPPHAAKVKRQDLGDQRWRRQKVLNSPLGPARWVRNAGKPPEKSHVAEVGSVTALWKEKLEATVGIC
jgi:hypothetical protein